MTLKEAKNRTNIASIRLQHEIENMETLEDIIRMLQAYTDYLEASSEEYSELINKIKNSLK